MTSSNHIVGGIAITGISLSFWDINLFSDSFYLGFCVFSSLLADVDHPKSLIGKVFYPLAKYLDRNYGHRTITHSFVFFISLFTLCSFFELNIFNYWFNKSDMNYSLIFFFAYLSHLILDMLTIQGIPFFYPFLKNPCVIPANPNLRFRSGHLKSESLAMLFFVMVISSSYSLFANGFWTTYNRSFGTIKHVAREFNRQLKLIEVDYKYYKFNDLKKGKALVLNATKYSTTLLEKNRIFILNQNDNTIKNLEIVPIKTQKEYKTINYKFNFVSIDSVNKLLNNIIISADINSNNKYLFQNKITNNSKFEFINNAKIEKIIVDSLDNNTKKIKLEIQKIKGKIQVINTKNNYKISKKNEITNALELAKSNLSKCADDEIYLKNKYETEIINLSKKLNNFSIELESTNNFYNEINILKNELNKKTKQYFNGKITILKL